MKYLEDLFGLNIGELNSYLFSFTKNLSIALIIFFGGFWIAKMISKSIKKVMLRGGADPGLTTFIASLANITLKILVFITAITQVGVEMTSFVALLGAAGLAVGMAFSGTLSNLAGGIMVLVFKPFKVGDFISAQGEQGIVKEIHIFNTYLSTPDNKVIIMPNGPLANGNITNFTKADKRRVDFVFGIAYGDDLKKAKEVLQKFIDEDKRILQDPAPFIGLGALADSSVNITVRVWSSVDDYWPVFFDMNERVYNEFGQHGLNIPFPQMDVHVHQTK